MSVERLFSITPLPGVRVEAPRVVALQELAVAVVISPGRLSRHPLSVLVVIPLDELASFRVVPAEPLPVCRVHAAQELGPGGY